MFFKNDFHDEIASWPMAFVPCPQMNVDDLLPVCLASGEAWGGETWGGDDSARFEAWLAIGDSVFAEAEAALSRGHPECARIAFMRASALYGAAFDSRRGARAAVHLQPGYHRQIAAFERGLALLETAVQPHPIVFGGITVPAYFVPAPGRENDSRPLVIFTTGRDATIADLYFAAKAAAAPRSYHSLIFCAPGRDHMLGEPDFVRRPDWTYAATATVAATLAAVVDYIVELPVVDRSRIAMSSWRRTDPMASRKAPADMQPKRDAAASGVWCIATASMALRRKRRSLFRRVKHGKSGGAGKATA